MNFLVDSGEILKLSPSPFSIQALLTARHQETNHQRYQSTLHCRGCTPKWIPIPPCSHRNTQSTTRLPIPVHSPVIKRPSAGRQWACERQWDSDQCQHQINQYPSTSEIMLRSASARPRTAHRQVSPRTDQASRVSLP